MSQAARLHDPISHTRILEGLVLGLMAGALIGVALVVLAPEVVVTAVVAEATVAGEIAITAAVETATVGAAEAAALEGTVAVSVESTATATRVAVTTYQKVRKIKQIARVVGSAVKVSKWTEFAGSLIHTTTGDIERASANVHIEGRPAARALLDVARCSHHHGSPILLAEGSKSVHINGFPAARMGDKCQCGAVIENGAATVAIGGATTGLSEDQIQSEIPTWLKWSVKVADLCANLVLKDPLEASRDFIQGEVEERVQDEDTKLAEQVTGKNSDSAKITGKAASFLVHSGFSVLEE